MSETIYNLLAKAIDLYVKIRVKFDPEWDIKNSSRIREWKLMAYAFSRSPIGIVGGFLVLITAITAIIGPSIAWQGYWEYKVVENPDLWLKPPCLPPSCSGGPLLGTDEWGRDVLAMIFYGVRISFVISLLIVLIGAPLGILLGLIAGYKGGVVDEVIMRITDMFVAFPGLVLAIAFATVLPQRIRGFLEANTQIRDFLLWLFGLRPQEYGQLAALLSVLLALVIVWWPIYARTVRGTVLSVREQVFIEAARSIGLSTWRILIRHILPNVLSPIIVMMTFDLATAALLSASLSFLGLGPQDPVPELGFMISKAGQYFPERSWHIVVFDGTVLLLIAFGWNLLGDSLRDVLDPRTRRAIEVRAKAKKKKR
ncbi:MAG: ABC transporter permease [Thermoprotei archaeon]|nr:MAG: ABC transporter permease [Thermoprotei archaeon]